VDLAEAPAILILAGITAYAILAGADFGAPVWAISARGEAAEQIAESGHRSMAPVWEANHVWLIFVLVVCWTAYPEVFGAVFSTLWIPLLLACLGIIMRAVTYVAGRAGSGRAVTWLAAGASLLVPFSLGTVIGALADGRVPAGNAQGDILTSWLAPVPLMTGLILVATSTYLAAVFLAADADRRGEDGLAEAFRLRGLVAGALTGIVATAGLLVLYYEARPFFEAMLMPGYGDSQASRLLVSLSAVAGTATIWLLLTRRFPLARYVAAAAVACVVAGWGLAQEPEILPGLSLDAAAASREVIIGLLIAVAIGLVLLIPSLYLLYSLTLKGRFDQPGTPSLEARSVIRSPGSTGRIASWLVMVAGLAGAAMLFFSDSGPVLYFGLALFMAGLAGGAVLLARSLAVRQG